MSDLQSIGYGILGVLVVACIIGLAELAFRVYLTVKNELSDVKKQAETQNTEKKPE